MLFWDGDRWADLDRSDAALASATAAVGILMRLFFIVFLALVLAAGIAAAQRVVPYEIVDAREIPASLTGRPGDAEAGRALYFDEKLARCAGCHGEAGAGGVTAAPKLLAKAGPEVKDAWERARSGGNIVVKAPVATILWDFIHRGMPLGNEGTLTPNEVYSLTAYLLAVNKIIPENQVIDQNNLAKVKMPIGNDWKRAPDWKPKSPRLQGYPY